MGMGEGDLRVWWRSLRRRTVEINGEDRQKGGDRPGVKFNWKVEINLEGGDNR